MVYGLSRPVTLIPLHSSAHTLTYDVFDCWKATMSVVLCYVMSKLAPTIQGLFQSLGQVVDKVRKLKWKSTRNVGYARHAKFGDLQSALGLSFSSLPSLSACRSAFAISSLCC